MRSIFSKPKVFGKMHYAWKFSLAAIVGALYFVLTYALAPLSFLQVQIRISEALIGLVPFFGWPVLLGMSIGCAIANIFSPLGPIDILIGTGATILGGIPIVLLRRQVPPYILFLFYVASNAFLVALELWWILKLPFWLSVGFVALGEVIACYGLGLPIYYTFVATFWDRLSKLDEQTIPDIEIGKVELSEDSIPIDSSNTLSISNDKTDIKNEVPKDKSLENLENMEKTN